MKLYFIAGENSGDFIGAKIIKAIREANIQGAETILFSGVGGNQMAEQGVRSLFDFQQINLMGFVEVLPHIRRIKKLIDSTVEDVINNGTDVLVTIDSPGFTFRVAQKVRLLVPGIKLVHIVAPSVWAYKPGRAKKYAKIYDKLLTLFPFEPPYFTAHGLDSVCIGHPILEQSWLPRSSVSSNDTKIICITPGSRRGEISRHMPVIREALNKLSHLHKIHAIFVQPNDSHVSYIEEYLKEANLEFSFSTDRQISFANSDVALAKSGTNTLEIAASGTPMIVGYKLNMLTYMIIKRLVKIKYASIINIIPNKEIIPEYIQSRFTADNIANALNELLSDKTKADKQVQEAQKILKTIGFGSKEVPSQKAAKIILEM